MPSITREGRLAVAHQGVVRPHQQRSHPDRESWCGLHRTTL